MSWASPLVTVGCMTVGAMVVFCVWKQMVFPANRSSQAIRHGTLAFTPFEYEVLTVSFSTPSKSKSQKSPSSASASAYQAIRVSLASTSSGVKGNDSVLQSKVTVSAISRW